jgi:hypothetical protein
VCIRIEHKWFSQKRKRIEHKLLIKKEKKRKEKGTSSISFS